MNEYCRQPTQNNFEILILNVNGLMVKCYRVPETKMRNL